MASVGFDPEDNSTALVPAGMQDVDFTANLESGSLKGLRLGLLNGFFNYTSSNETAPVNDAMSKITAKLEGAGAVIINITDPLYNTTDIASRLDTQIYEFRERLDAYLSRPSLKGQHPKSTGELFSTDDFLVLPSQYAYVKTILNSSTSNQTLSLNLDRPSYNSVRRGIEDLTLSLAETIRSHQLDALIYPEQKNLVVRTGSASQSGRNGILAALTGSPIVTMPIGFSGKTEMAPEGIPIGMEVLGMPWTEEKLLQIAWQMEQSFGRVRRTPSWARKFVDVKRYEGGVVPNLRPDLDNIPKGYPDGVLG